MKSDKVDLSNVGGQPKDWAQRSHEAEIAFSETERLKFGLAPALGVLAIVVGAGYFLFRVL